MKLLASSGTENGIIKLVNEYFYSENCTLINGKIYNKKLERTLDNYSIIKKRKRYYFYEN